MKILIISDIHRDLKTLQKILDKESNSDLKIFLGDFQLSRNEQKRYSNFFDYVVQGNNDYSGISEKEILVEIEGIKILLVHGDYYNDIYRYVDKSKLVNYAKKLGAKYVFHGHDHIANKTIIDGITIFNPGSPSFPRGNSKASYGIMIIENKNVTLLKNFQI